MSLNRRGPSYLLYSDTNKLFFSDTMYRIEVLLLYVILSFMITEVTPQLNYNSDCYDAIRNYIKHPFIYKKKLFDD